jgi:hypothetical protein
LDGLCIQGGQPAITQQHLAIHHQIAHIAGLGGVDQRRVDAARLLEVLACIRGLLGFQPCFSRKPTIPRNASQARGLINCNTCGPNPPTRRSQSRAAKINRADSSMSPRSAARRACRLREEARSPSCWRASSPWPSLGEGSVAVELLLVMNTLIHKSPEPAKDATNKHPHPRRSPWISRQQ